MRKYLSTICLMIAVIGIIASIYLEDSLFAISFLWVLVNDLISFADEQ